MDAFKQQLQRIQEQLSGLTGTQRMLVFSLVTVMVLTLLLWSRYAATPDMVPLLTQAVGPQDQARIHTALAARNIRFRDSGATVMVSPDDLNSAIAAVASENAFPTDSTGKTLSSILDRMTPFDSQSKSSEYWRIYTAERIREIVRQMDGVRTAAVNISTASQQRIGGGSQVPSAVVYVATRTPQEKVSRNFVEGIAAIVAGSLGGVKRGDINIVIDDRHYPLLDHVARGGSNVTGDLLEQQTQWENQAAEKVARALNFIPGVMVSVSAKVNIESKESRLQVYEELKSKDKEFTSETSETSQSGGINANDAGVAANTGGTLAIGASPLASSVNTSTTEKTVTKSEIFPNKRDEVTIKPAGEPTVIAASVSIPRTYYLKQMRAGDPSAKDPEPGALDARVAQENSLIQEQVRSLLGLADASAVTVRMFVDEVPAWATTGGATGEAAGVSANLVAAVAGRYAKEIGIGILAGASLLMVMMIVRRSAPAPLVMPPEPVGRGIGEIVAIDGNEPLVGIAAAGNPALDAMELADEDLQSQQMVDQVSNMVKDNPDAAAALLKRWLNRS